MLSTAIAEQAGLVCNFRKDTMESMKAVLEDAEQQSVKNKSVRLRLNHAAHDISDMMDEYHDTAKVRVVETLTSNCKTCSGR
jgi:hypothetical protein